MPDVKAGTRLILYFEDEVLVEVQVDEQATESAQDRIKSRHERLKHSGHIKDS